MAKVENFLTKKLQELGNKIEKEDKELNKAIEKANRQVFVILDEINTLKLQAEDLAHSGVIENEAREKLENIVDILEQLE